MKGFTCDSARNGLLDPRRESVLRDKTGLEIVRGKAGTPLGGASLSAEGERDDGRDNDKGLVVVDFC